MIKRCKGCGIVLQDQNPQALGYVPDLNKNTCTRCFKIQNYGYQSSTELNSDNKKIIKEINEKKELVFFISDFLSVTKEVIDSYKKINNPKVFILNKTDILPKSFKFSKIKNYIANYYQIKEDIIFISGKKKKNLNKIFEIMQKNSKNKALLVGYTNSGKSTLINALTNHNLTTSYLPNTTLAFMPVVGDENYTLYDTPGLILSKNLFTSLEYKLLKNNLESKTLKEITYQTKENMIINILDKLSIKSDINNNITIYLSDKLKINRAFKDKLSLPKTILNIKDNSDIIIPGVCLINIKKAANLEIGIKDPDIIEVRPSIFS